MSGRPFSYRTACLGIFTGLLTILIGGCPNSTDGPPDPNANEPAVGRLIQVPDPLSGDNPAYKLLAVGPPNPGQSVSDARLATQQTRVVQTAGLRHEYSRHDPYNRDQSLILLLDIAGGHWGVYRTDALPYDRAAGLVASPEIEEPRWDPEDANILWGLRDFSLLTIDVRSGQTTTIKDFSHDPELAPILAAEPDLYRITMRDEGESSEDKRYWAFILQGTEQDYRPRYVIAWDRRTDRLLGLLQIQPDQADVDWVGMSPAGTWVLIGGSENNAGNLAGLVMANRELTEFHRIDYATGHADVGRDRNGREVIVMQNIRTDHIDMIPLELATKPILEIGGSYAGTNRVPLLRLFYADSPIGLHSGVHISCNYAGYCVVSTYIEPDMPERNWLDRSIVLVELDPGNPRAFYLAKVHGTTGAYWEETHAVVTRDGRRVIWSTNWNRDVGRERVWDVVLDLPR